MSELVCQESSDMCNSQAKILLRPNDYALHLCDYHYEVYKLVQAAKSKSGDN